MNTFLLAVKVIQNHRDKITDVHDHTFSCAILHLVKAREAAINGNPEACQDNLIRAITTTAILISRGSKNTPI